MIDEGGPRGPLPALARFSDVGLIRVNTVHCNTSIYTRTMQAILTIEVMIYSLHVVITRKYLHCGNIIGKIKHTTT